MSATADDRQTQRHARTLAAAAEDERVTREWDVDDVERAARRLGLPAAEVAAALGVPLRRARPRRPYESARAVPPVALAHNGATREVAAPGRLSATLERNRAPVARWWLLFAVLAALAINAIMISDLWPRLAQLVGLRDG